MAITAASMVANVRSRTDTQRTRFITDDEILTFINDESKDFWAQLIASRENYVTKSAQFTLTSQAVNSAALPADFLKPVAVSRPLDNSNGRREIVLPLESLSDRTNCPERRYWIMDQKIFIYPQIAVPLGPYDFDYCPRWTDLTLSPSTSLPLEFEQFDHIAELGASASVKRKRKMFDEAAAFDLAQDKAIKSAIAVIPGRKGGPKQIPMPLKDARRFYRGGFPYGGFYGF